MIPKASTGRPKTRKIKKINTGKKTKRVWKKIWEKQYFCFSFFPVSRSTGLFGNRIWKIMVLYALQLCGSFLKGREETIGNARAETKRLSFHCAQCRSSPRHLPETVQGTPEPAMDATRRPKNVTRPRPLWSKVLPADLDLADPSPSVRLYRVPWPRHAHLLFTLLPHQLYSTPFLKSVARIWNWILLV